MGDNNSSLLKQGFFDEPQRLFPQSRRGTQGNSFHNVSRAGIDDELDLRYFLIEREDMGI